jgi:Flp pilus assembly CpaF family ATPase
MRPDRIIIGECRGAETLDMIQAMNADNRGRLTCLFHTQFSTQSGRFFSVFCAFEARELSAI